MNQDMKSVKLKKSERRFGEAYLRAEDPQAHRLPSTISYLSRKKARIRTILIHVNTFPSTPLDLTHNRRCC
ncbi:hypothetical protein HBH56_142290 [Parastagonospora nodorum]|nr:hypothetical protein HBH56_142290 [Parastagonospora nodorum]KAH3927831.1 hypothetical protein HBH54_147480 [Parastagonospora nodorum]KAH3947900.1 hypothetical protein HBH53_107560 [Parastagonospora nodorum]KAH4020343.1 hypothetical protein HBI13_113730 [Parastagonospora nodorum]KAH4065161.1 hypothetical protein HBH50_162830 [Parastagonospora nodorum]